MSRFSNRILLTLLLGLFFAKLFRVGKLDLMHYSKNLFMTFCRCAALMNQQSLCNLFFDGQNRI